MGGQGLAEGPRSEGRVTATGYLGVRLVHDDLGHGPLPPERKTRLLETVNFVTPRLAVGGRYFWPARLRKAGITHVLSVRRRPDTLDGFVCCSNPMADEGLGQPAGYWRRTTDYALETLADPAHRLYVHCAAGKNRGPAHVYAILLALGHPPDEARTLIRKARRKATPRYFDAVEAAILRPDP